MNWVSGVCRGIVHLGEKITGLQGKDLWSIMT